MIEERCKRKQASYFIIIIFSIVSMYLVKVILTYIDFSKIFYPAYFEAEETTDPLLKNHIFLKTDREIAK